MGKFRRWPFALLIASLCACGARSNLWDDDDSPTLNDPAATNADAGHSILIADAGARFDATIGTDAAIESGVAIDASIACPAFAAAPSGSAYWAQIIKGPGQITGTAADSAGNLIIIGDVSGGAFTIGSTTVTNNSPASQLTFVAKLDVAGNVVFLRILSGADQFAGGVAVDDAGNIIITGMFFGTVNLGEDPSTLLSSAGQGAGIYFGKLDPNGHQLWAKAFPAHGVPWPAQVSVTPQDDIVLSGGFESTIYFDNTPNSPSFVDHGENDEPFLAKFTANGDMIWARAFAAPAKADTLPGGFAPGGSIVGQSVDPQGNIYVSGGFVQSLTFSEPLADGGAGIITAFSGTNNSAEGFISKIDANGNYIWGRPLPSDGFSSVLSIAADNEGDVVGYGEVVGSLDFTEIDAGLSADNLTGDGVGEFLFGIDPATGAATRLTIIGGSTGEGAGIAFDSTNNLFVGSSIGTSQGPLTGVPIDHQGAFAARFGATGTPVWSNTVGAPRSVITMVAVDRCGLGFYTGGFVYDAATFARADVGNDVTIGAPDAGPYASLFVARLAR